MAQPKDPDWQARIKFLHDRLDALEASHFDTVTRLRADILALTTEQAAADGPVGAAEPDVSMTFGPVPVMEPKPSPEPVLEAAAVEAAPGVPPPLPPSLPSGRPLESPLPRETPPMVARPVATPPPLAEGGFELRFGRIWLVRLGVALLLTGLVLLGNFAYKNWIREMPAGVRLAALFALSLALAETGRRLARRQTLATFGEVILAGGMAFFYYCTYASHHVGRLKVIESPVVAAICLLGAAGAIAAVSWLRQSRSTAVLGLLLASYSTMLQPIGWLSAVSNTLLAASGLLLMTRPGWLLPGIVSMACTYGSFLGWQVMGASQGDLRDPSALWFLPPIWAVFTLPGVWGKFRATMPPHGRAWFVGANNAAFFILFSAIWVQIYGEEGFWRVPAVIGLVLLGLGIIGRRASEIAGGVNLSQGLLLLTWAMIIRLEGFHLALALGTQSLTLSVAYLRFRGRSELAFSAIAAVGAAWIVLGHYLETAGGGTLFAAVPRWTAGVVPVLIGAASAFLLKAMGQLPASSRAAVRWIPAGLFFLAIGTSIIGWVLRLPEISRMPVLAAFACAFSGAAVAVDRRWRIPELPAASIVYLASTAALAVFTPVNGWLGLTALLILGAAWFWHRLDHHPVPEEVSRVDQRRKPHEAAWAFTLAAVALFWKAYGWPDEPSQSAVMILAGAGAAGIALAAGIRCARLAPAGVLLLVAALVEVQRAREWSDLPQVSGFGIVIGASLVSLALLVIPWVAGQLGTVYRNTAAVFVRIVLFISVLGFWHEWNSTYFGDGLALVASVLIAAALIRKKPVAAEAWGFLAIGTLWLIGVIFSSWIGDGSVPSWRGAMVVGAALSLSAVGKHLGTSIPRAAALVTPASAISAVLASVWVTQMLVWRHGWHHTTVLWTVLGFVAVGAGLGLRLRMFRFTGFALLGLAIAKLFAIDVWDFSAFTRVVSFIALGVAMILLGLFYNRFASVLKQLLEDEEK